MSKILLVDDDTELADVLHKWLCVSEGHVFETLTNGEDGLQAMRAFEFDIILLDWSLPGISGVEVCRQYRAAGGSAFIIFLTGKGDIESKEQGLAAGGDDYLVKPFDVRELSARIKSILRRPSGYLPTELKIRNVSLDPQNRKAMVGDIEIHLMPKESALLEYLMRHPNAMFDSQALHSAVWPSESGGSKETVRTWMRNLRQKLAKAGEPDFIVTVVGSGYKIELDTSKKTGS